MALPEEPLSRNEHYLANIAGQNIALPEPITREDHYLDYIARNGGGGGGGGLPPVSGSGKALVSVNGEWVEQNGFPYDEGETTETKFDETFSGFTRGTEESTNYIYPIDSSDAENENNVTIGGVTYYYVDSNAYDYSSIDSCTVRDENGNQDYPSGLEFVQSGAVKNVEIPYSIEQYDPETGDPTDPLTGTLYGVYAPNDGAQDADGNVFPASGFYCTANGDISGSFVGVESISMTYSYPSEYWTATVPLDSGIEFDSEKNYRVYIDGESVEGAYADYTYIYLDENGNSYVSIDEDEGFTAKAYLYVEDYETAPDNLSVKADEVISGVHTMDSKYINGKTLPDAAALPNGTAAVVVDGKWRMQDTYGYKYLDWTQVHDENVTFTNGEERKYTNVTVYPYPELDSPETGKLRILIDGDEFIVIPTFVGGNNSWLYAVTEKNFAFLWSNLDPQYFEYTGEIQEGEEVSFTVSIECYQEQYETMDSRYIPWSDAPTGTGLPEPTYEDGTYVLQATESDGEMSYEWSASDTVPMEVTYDDDTTETFNVLIRPTE